MKLITMTIDYDFRVVSYLYSGVNDNAVRVTEVSITPLCILQRCHWHCCATNFVNYLREFEAIFEKALTWVSGTQRKKYDEKNRGFISRVRIPLSTSARAQYLVRLSRHEMRWNSHDMEALSKRSSDIEDTGSIAMFKIIKMVPL
jgi:hypothetical protein